MTNDLALWNKVQNGDTASLKVLHSRYYYPMLVFVKRNYPNTSGLEELVSDCFIKLWTKRHEIIIDRSVKAYLFLMLRNQLIDNFRKKKWGIQIDLSSIPDVPSDDTIEELDDYAKLYIALEKIPEQRRRILELAIFESHSYAEIAIKLEISINTVKTQIGRAYRFLKEELDPKSIQLLFLLKIQKKRI